jgi:competence protein ComEA
VRNTLTNLVAALVTFAVLVPAVQAAEQAPAGNSPAGVININTADASQLAHLPRIGPKAAERIVEYRTANGPFRKTTDLMQVKGIGEKSFEVLRPYLTVEGPTTLGAKQRSGQSRSGSKSKAKAGSAQ